MTLLKNFLKHSKGATAMEYGLIAAFVTLIVIAAVTLMGTNLTTTFHTFAGKL